MTSKVRLTILFGILALLALTALTWNFALSPRLQTAGDLNIQAEQVELANVQALSRYSRLRDQAQEIPAAAEDAKRLFASMPQEADLPTLLTQITEAAEAAGIPANDITVLSTGVPTPIDPGAENPSVRLATITLDLNVRGSVAEFNRLLDNLAGLDRSLLIETTNVTIPPEGGQGASLQLKGSIFVLQSPLSELVANVEKLIEDAGLLDDTTPNASTE